MAATQPLIIRHVTLPPPTNGSRGGGRRKDHPIVTLLDDPKSLDFPKLKQIHAQMLRLHLLSHPYSASKLLSSLLPSNLPYAHNLFDQIPQPNLYSYNALIRANSSGPNPETSLRLLLDMLVRSPHSPNNFTFPFAIKAASFFPSPDLGSALHAMVVKSEYASDVFILNSLVHFYAGFGELEFAFKVFDKIPQRDVVSWNSIIAALVGGGRGEEALRMFKEMDLKPNDVTMVSVLSACSLTKDLDFGRWVHQYITEERNEVKKSLILSNAILDMYVKCGALEDAKNVFDEIVERDSISWTTMLVGYTRSGDTEAAQIFFNAMPNQDIAAWNALISGYEQNGKPKEALDIFRKLQKDPSMKPDQVTLVAALSACSQLGAIELGTWIHTYIQENGFKLNFHLTTSLIDMYSKCGELEEAIKVFRSVGQRDVFVWSAMIAGFAMHGKGKDALKLFVEMQEANVKPNKVTFTNVLCACSHAGLVSEGRLYFNQMHSIYGIERNVEHYSCMVDILGRAGLIDEAMELIAGMPMPPPASAWGAILGACAVHGNMELGEKAFNRLIVLEPGNDGAYVLLSNLYAKSRKWDSVAKLRKLMRDRGLKKERGSSSIEADGVVHEFLVGDNFHPDSERIYSKLREIVEKIREAGYVPNRTQLLQNIEDESLKEHALLLHSEKLAIAFGLISTAPSKPIRISKNLRICDDCHSAAKLISTIYNKEIFLRDRYRFHHFKDGDCSCMDYW